MLRVNAKLCQPLFPPEERFDFEFCLLNDGLPSQASELCQVRVVMKTAAGHLRNAARSEWQESKLAG